MKHAPVFLLCLAWSLVAAIPLIEPAVNENFNVTLEVADVAAAKINNIPGKSCRCGATTNPRSMVYKVDDIKAAAKALADHVDGGTEVLPPGTRAGFGYPHRYNVNDAAVRTELAKKQYEKVCQRGDEIYEFPITRGVYKSGPVDQIADRILLRKVKKGQYNYCLLITHLDAPANPPNGFVPCSC